MQGKRPIAFLSRGTSWSYTSVETDRLLAFSHQTAEPSSACDLHVSGAGSIALTLGRATGEERQATRIQTFQVVEALISELLLLAKHCRDRAATTGPVRVRSGIWPVTKRWPAKLMEVDSDFGDGPGQIRATPATTEAVLELDDLADAGPTLIKGVHRLATGLFQHFGHPESQQTRADGALRGGMWGSAKQAAFDWTQQNGVSFVA